MASKKAIEAAKKKRKAALGTKSYTDVANMMDPPRRRQAVEQAMNGRHKVDSVCRFVAKKFVKAPVEQVFPEFYA